MARVAVYVAYDPTNDEELTGIERSSVLFDEVVVAVDALHLATLREATRAFVNVRCQAHSGPIAELARASGASHVVRAISDVANSAVALAGAKEDHRMLPEIVSIVLYAGKP